MEKNLLQTILNKITTSLKKTFKVFRVISIVILVITIGTLLFNYQTETRQENKINIVIKPSDTCKEGYPMEVTIRNNSNRTIENITIYTKATQEGYSTNLADYSPIKSDKILKTGEGIVMCWVGKLSYEYQTTYKPQDLVWKVDNIYVDFEELKIFSLFK